MSSDVFDVRAAKFAGRAGIIDGAKSRDLTDAESTP